MESFSIVERVGPVVATAIHAGHDLRPDTAAQMALSDADRLREEDPETGRMADIGTTLVTVYNSRFEVDLNRSRESAVYRTPEEAWGLHVWRSEPAEESIRTSLETYDYFYEEMRALITRKVAAHGCALILDVHSYNHRRGGPKAPAEDPALNPEVNLGTGTLNRAVWAPVIASFAATLSDVGFDVRENVKFRGGHFVRWVHETFPTSAVALAVEFKKTFMDEWSSEVDERAVMRVNEALRMAAAAAAGAALEVISS